MSITANDVLYAKQSPQKLAKALGKNVTANEVFYMEQDPSKTDEQTGYYLPFTVELPDGSTSIQMYSSRLQEWRTIDDSDKTAVVFLGADSTTAKAVTVQLKTNDNVTLTLSVATATFNE